MAIPTYDELLAKRRVTSSTMKQTFDNDNLQKFSLELDRWEKLARIVGIPHPEIENIKSQGDMDEQKIKMLVCWKQRRGSMATYEVMARALLKIGRTDLAEKVQVLHIDAPHRILSTLKQTIALSQVLMSQVKPCHLHQEVAVELGKYLLRLQFLYLPLLCYQIRLCTQHSKKW